jgi:hypothetical protein
MTFEDQVRLVNEHVDIFSNAGSAAHNVLFALHEPRLHLLTNGHRFSPDYFLYSHSSVVSTATSFVNCLSTGDRPAYKGAQKRTPHLLHMPILLEYLHQRGFVTTSLPAWTIEQGSKLQAEYDELWFYGYVRAVDKRVALPGDVEEAAWRLAPTSWPVSLALSQYYAQRDITRADNLARQFADLAATETDSNRLASYRSEVAEMAPMLVSRCSPETAGWLAEVAAHRFFVPLQAEEQLP